MTRKSREEAELRRENESLKRQVSRLRKQVERLSGESPEEAEEAAEPPPPEKCPLCGSQDLGRLSTPSGKKIKACRSCKKWRG